MNRKYLPIVPVLLAFAVMLTVAIVSPGNRQLVSQIAFYCALAGAFNLFMGMTGYVDFGYVAFMGVGTYGMAVAVYHFPETGLAVTLLGAAFALLVSTLLALAVGAVALRLRGAYFAIATVGVNEGLRHLVEGAKLFRGSQGILYFHEMNTALSPEGASAMQTFWADIAIIVIAFAAAATTLWMLRSKMGYALTAMREDELAARVLGINVTRYKITAFVISAMLAGLLGAAKGLKTPLIYPETAFYVHYTIEAILIVMLGGAGTLTGPIIGAALYSLAKYALAIYLPGFQLLIFAPLMLVIVVLFPTGIAGYLKARLRHTRWEPYVL